MRIIPLVAAYREPKELLEGLLSQLGQHFAQTVICLDQYAYNMPTGTLTRRGHWHHERDKRNALLEYARMELEPTVGDWFLSVDPDERLIGVAGLAALLERVPVDQPAYPLLRQERDGRVWAVPCKLFRGTATRYLYLDTHLEFGPAGGDDDETTWNLDPYQVAGKGVVAPGWPGLIHLGPRRDPGRGSPFADDDFYTELEPPAAAIDYQAYRAAYDQFRDPEGVIRL